MRDVSYLKATRLWLTLHEGRFLPQGDGLLFLRHVDDRRHLILRVTHAEWKPCMWDVSYLNVTSLWLTLHVGRFVPQRDGLLFLRHVDDRRHLILKVTPAEWKPCMWDVLYLNVTRLWLTLHVGRFLPQGDGLLFGCACDATKINGLNLLTCPWTSCTY